MKRKKVAIDRKFIYTKRLLLKTKILWKNYGINGGDTNVD